MPGITAGVAYDLCTRPPQRGWFGLPDCALRWSLAVAAFYFYLITNPVSFPVFCVRYNRTWYGTQPVRATVMSLLFLVMPFALMIDSAMEAIWRFLRPAPEMEAATKIWFSLPSGVISPILWQSQMNVARLIALYMLAGNDPVALEHIIEERLTTKDFWRDLMRKGGCRVPKQLGRWDGQRLRLTESLEGHDVVIKLTDSFFGIGDQFWEFGKDFSSAADLERKIASTTYESYEGGRTDYKGKELLVLEFCRPPANLGVHSMDVLTVATPEGVKVLTCLFWGECTGPSSHSTTAGYMVDIEKEEICAPCRWYAPYFATASDKLVGMKVPGVKKACEQALAAHSQTPFGWMRTVGWDCMVLKSGEVVFFEGNFGTIRIPRRIFLAASCLRQFITTFAWPFAARRPDIFAAPAAAGVATSAGASPTPSPPDSVRRRRSPTLDEDSNLIAG